MGRYSKNGPDAMWRSIVKTRADNHCEVCGKKQSPKRLHAHHLYSYSKYPQYRTNPEFGACLCKHCHMDLFHSIYGPITTPEQFLEFKNKYSIKNPSHKKIKVKVFKKKKFKVKNGKS